MCLYTYRNYIILMRSHFLWLQSMKIEVHLPLMVIWFLLENCGMHHSGMKVRWLQFTLVERNIYTAGLSYPVSADFKIFRIDLDRMLVQESLPSVVWSSVACHLHGTASQSLQSCLPSPDTFPGWRVAKHLLPLFVPFMNSSVGHAKKMWCSPLQLCSMPKIPCLHDCKLTRI